MMRAPTASRFDQPLEDRASLGEVFLNVISFAFVFLLLANQALSAPTSSQNPKQVGASTPASAAGEFDGPAELPRVRVRSALVDTPAPGKTLTVNAGGDLQRALNQAQCGDTIRLQAGATFSGVFKVPAKNCDDSHWIVVRTSTSDASLPREGTRITPCYAGVASLPGRPAYDCPSPENRMAKIELVPQQGSGPLVLANGASHYRFLGLEITRPAGSGPVSNLVLFRPDASAHHIIFDRVWVHGTPQDETARGVLLEGTYNAIVDSFFSDFHCTAITGACVDSQAISGGIGDQTMGPYKIDNNFLEAAAESIIFGGSTATATPTDIEIRHNYLFKPLTWKPGSGQFVGGNDGHPFIVKNHFELKNAARVLFEGNILENTWGGFSQTGSSILLTPKNQAGQRGANLCPACEVTDVTIRYCLVQHVGGGMQLGNGRSDNGGVPRDGERYSIHDVVFDDIDAAAYKGNGFLAIIATAPDGSAPILQHIKMDHLTAFPSTGLFNIGGPQSQKMSDVSFTNSIVHAGNGPSSFTTTGGGQQNCSAQIRDPRLMLDRCFSSYVFAKNVIIGARAGNWPNSNFQVSRVSDLHFADFREGRGGDYHLLPASRYKKVSSDGKDLGADVDAVNQAIAGVR